MRKVQTYKYEKPIPPSLTWNKIRDKVGVFHQFGINYEELEGGPGSFTTAIVEMPDGTVENIPVKNIKFLDKPK